MRSKLIPLTTLVAGLLVIACIGLLLLDEHVLPKENGSTYLMSESLRNYGAADEIVDGLALLALLGALVACLGVGLLAIFTRNRALVYGGIAAIVAAMFMFIHMTSLPTYPSVVMDGVLLTVGVGSVWLASAALFNPRQVNH